MLRCSPQFVFSPCPALLWDEAGTERSVLDGGSSVPVLSPPSASQTEFIPLRVSGKSLTVTDERETIQQSLNRYRAQLLPCPCPGRQERG